MKTQPSLFRALAAACALSTTLTPFTSAQIGGQIGGQAPTGQIPLEILAPFNFSPTKPRLVVLLHGVTPKKEESPEQQIGKAGHGRHYWGFKFIKGLQGESNGDKMNLIRTTSHQGTFHSGKTINWTDPWTPQVTEEDEKWSDIYFPSNLGPISQGMEFNTPSLKTYIKLMCNQANTMVMINTRDGSKHLMPQVAETVEELYRSYRAVFGILPEPKQPQIYLVCHSFGGIVARTMLANPTAPDLFGNKLTAAQRWMIEYLRKRVVLVTTMGTPYEGSIIGDAAGDIADFIAWQGPAIIYNFLEDINKLPIHDGNPRWTKEQIRQKTKETVQMALNAVSGKRDCLKDVSIAGMKAYNAGLIKPNAERRKSGGDLIPFFTLGGRNPGNRALDDDRGVFLLGNSDYNAISIIDILSKGTRQGKEAMALNLIEGLLHQYGYGHEGKRPWGTAVHPLGDRFSSPWAGLGPNNARPVAAGWVPDKDGIINVVKRALDGGPYIQFDSDGEYDSDGFCGWDSANAIHLTGTNFYRIANDSLYGSNLPWDIDHHGSMMFNVANGAWIYNELISQAGPLVKVGARKSVWSLTDTPPTPSNAIRVEVRHLEDITGNIDVGDDELHLTVRINGLTTSRTLPDGDVHLFLPPFDHSGIPNTIIPIQISVLELDNPNADPHDICVVSPESQHSTLYLWYDTRTNRIMGDAYAEGGTPFTIKPNWSGVNTHIKTVLNITQVLPH